MKIIKNSFKQAKILGLFYVYSTFSTVGLQYFPTLKYLYLNSNTNRQKYKMRYIINKFSQTFILQCLHYIKYYQIKMLLVICR